MNIIKRLLIGITMVVSIFILSACSIYGSEYMGGDEIESGDFIYRVNPETDEAMIYSFSERGKQKTTIVIPTMIDGHKVTTIGYLLMSSFGDNWYCDFESEKLVNLYFHSLIELQDLKNSVYENSSNIQNVFLPFNKYSIRYNLYGKGDTVFVSREGFLVNNHQSKYDDCKKEVSNISYHLNDDSEYDIFFVDYVEDGGLTNVIPPNPIRDCYTFMGWYKESECINKWDFDNDVVPAPIYDSETGELTNITRLYAKWE